MNTPFVGSELMNQLMQKAPHPLLGQLPVQIKDGEHVFVCYGTNGYRHIKGDHYEYWSVKYGQRNAH